jgi:hypothetical protein
VDVTGLTSRAELDSGRPGGIPEPFSVEVRPERARVVVAPHAEFDLASVERLGAEVDGLVIRGFDAAMPVSRLFELTGLRTVLALEPAP